MTRRAVSSLIATMTLAAAVPAVAQPAAPGDEVRIVVLGHIRGDAGGGLNPRLPELLEEVAELAPDLVVLTGDIIWGDVRNRPAADPARVEAEWDEVDAALAPLGVPIHRVPGNHDISGVGTRDIWWRRYGSLPRAVTVGDIRLLLLSSAWIPEDGDARHNPYVRGVDLPEEQVRWLEAELAKPASPVTLAFMHHLLWWQAEDGRWWREVHPLLARAGVDAVFTGDYGPLKFSFLERDDVRYYQSSIETPVSLDMLRINMPSRVLSAQFDNYLEVVVRGGAVDVRVHTIAEESSGEFTPERHTLIWRGPPPPIMARVRDFFSSRNRIAAVVVGLGGAFVAGVWVGRRRRRGGATK